MNPSTTFLLIVGLIALTFAYDTFKSLKRKPTAEEIEYRKEYARQLARFDSKRRYNFRKNYFRNLDRAMGFKTSKKKRSD